MKKINLKFEINAKKVFFLISFLFFVYLLYLSIPSLYDTGRVQKDIIKKLNQELEKFKKTIEESLQNIQDDRKLTLDLLKELRAEINSGETNHGRSGVIAAKYVETLQRSNEQLVKLAAIVHKKESAANTGLWPLSHGGICCQLF